MSKQLTEHIQLCIGSNWLVSSIGADLALVRCLVLEGGVDDLQVEDPTFVGAQNRVARESRQVPIITWKKCISS